MLLWLWVRVWLWVGLRLRVWMGLGLGSSCDWVTRVLAHHPLMHMVCPLGALPAPLPLRHTTR